MSNTDTSTPVITVPVKSAWASKVNWTQAISAVATCATALIAAANLPAAQAAALTAMVAGIGQFATVIFKTWFTTSVTPASAAKVS